ncbi:MAG: hypothetical protein ACR2QM_00345 [Longimicrobiales bacterium]
MAETATRYAVFRVIDAHDHPHGGRILRLRLLRGDAPSRKEFTGSEWEATGPDGEKASLTVLGFAVFGGNRADARLSKSGRADVHILESGSRNGEGEEPADPAIGFGWELSGPLG